MIAIFLLSKTDLWCGAAIAIVLTTFFTGRMAEPVQGLDIALPVFVLPILAALISILIAYNSAHFVAHISETLETLIDSDILNLKKSEAC